MKSSIASLQIIASPHIGGAETSMLRLIEALNAAGHPATAGVRAGSDLHRRLEGEPGLRTFSMRNYVDLGCVAHIRRAIEELGVAVVQTWASRASWLTRAPDHVVHVARLGGYYKLRYFRHADGWIVNTRGLRDWMVGKGFPPDRVEWINNFVPTVPAGTLPTLSRETLGIPAEALVVIALGRFIDKKGFQDLLPAFARLPQRIGGRPVHLVLLGAGPLLAELRSAAGAAPGRIHFTGWVDAPLPLLGLADVFVCPSRVEPMGNVVLEAWSQGLPVICTETTGGTELIRSGDTGLLTPVQDVPRLAAAMERVLRDTELRSALAGHGLSYFRHRYDERKTVEATLAFYRRLLQRRRSRR